MNVLININNFLHLMGISIWIGSIIFFSFGVAGPVFKNLDSKTVAGKLNGIFLKKLNKVEIISIIFLTVSFLIYFINPEYRSNMFILRVSVFIIMSLNYFAYSGHVTNKSEELKNKIGNFDTSENTPERIEFNKYHKLYVKLLSANLFLGFLLIFLTGLSLKP